jgi:MFS family permease
VLLAVIVRLTLREPPRGYSECIADSGVTPTLASTLSYIFRHASLRHLSFAGAAHGIGAFAAAVWLPSYFIRVFGLSSGEAGTWMAIAYGCGGGAGVLCGGYVADLIVKKTGDQRWYAWGSASVILAAIPCAAAVYLTARPAVAVAALLLATMLGHMFLGPVMAMLQGLAELRRRAVAAAVYLFLVNLVSMGVGPVTIGIVSDRFSPVYGNDALRYALLTIVTVTSIWAAGHFMAAARTLRGDLERARNAIELDARL